MAWSNAKPVVGRERKPYLSEEIELFQFPKRKWIQVRYLGPFTSYAQGWLRIRTKDGKRVRFPKICLDYNPKTQEFEDRGCPYRAAEVYMPQRYVANMIVRDLQDNPPRKLRPPTQEERRKQKMLGERWRIKDPESKTWTPVRAQDMPAGLALRLANMSELNTRRKDGKKISYDIADPRNGMDVMIKYNPDAKGPGMWDVQRADQTRLSEEELNYCIYNLENLKSLEPETRKVAREEWKRIEKVFIPEKRDKKKGSGKSNRRDRDGDRRSSSRERDSNSSKRERNRDTKNRSRNSDRKRARRNDLGDLDDLD